MANMIRTSWTSLSAIPEEHQFLMHRMYEDSDLEGAGAAEATFDFIEQEDPGRFVVILANDSVTPPCCTSEGHYRCDYYAEYWYTVLVKKATWNLYKERVMAADQEHKAAHQCKLVTKGAGV